MRELLDEVGLTMFEFVADRVSYSFYATTFRHDGHLFIQAARGGILHHPDCNCP